MNDFWKENDLDGSQGDLRALGHTQRPRQAQPWGVQQVPFIFIKMNIWNMFHEQSKWLDQDYISCRFNYDVLTYITVMSIVSEKN